jgi:NADH pyrophosphatase NudC (nudix superfamily)
MSEEYRMANQDEDKLTEEQKQLYRKTRVPHKFCPNCGTRNEASADTCANCGKDISWMRVPEPVPYSEPPKQKPRGLPEQKKVFTPRVILVIAIIVALLFAFVLVLLLSTKGKSAELYPAVLVVAGLCGPGAWRGSRPTGGRSTGRCARPRTATRSESCSTSTSRRPPS